MKRLFVALLCLVCIFNAHADNNNTTTSKDYVDAQIATLQDEVPAINSNTVLTHTGTSGEIGSKKIYDANSDYGSQTDALMTAGAFNAAVQNAIDTEFVCIDWLGEHVPGNCLLWQIQNKTAQQIVPDGYTQLEYLESTGTQWINTGRNLYGTDTVEMKYSDFVKYRSDNMIFGHYSANSFAYNMLGDTIYVYLHSVNGVPVYGINDTGVHIIRLGNNRFYFDNQLKLRLDDRLTNFQTDSPSSIFAAGSSYLSKVKVYYYMVINSNNEIVQYFIPVRRNSDNVLGMYDTVSNTFFTNSGSGTFIAGPDMNSNLYLPTGN